MDSNIIKCPICGQPMKISGQPADNYTFSCVACKQNIKFSDCKKVTKKTIVTDNEKTRINTNNFQSISQCETSEKTILNNPNLSQSQNISSKKAIGCLVDLSTSIKYKLKEGKNTIGRQASSNEATIQVQTSDRYMSRYHLGIDVINGSNEFVHNAYNLKENAETKINTSIIGSHDQIILTDGDIIQLGDTKFKFELI